MASEPMPVKRRPGRPKKNPETGPETTLPPITPAPAMPANSKVVLCQVMAEIGHLVKSDRNEHGNYRFASIDTFLERTQAVFAKHGLWLDMDEVECRIDVHAGKPYVYLKFAFALRGWADTKQMEHRSVMGRFTGAQTFGALQSYALKQYLRAKFLIPTGDKDDADYDPPITQGEENDFAPVPVTSMSNTDPVATTGGDLDDDSAKEAAFLNQLEACTTNKNVDDVVVAFRPWFQTISKAKYVRLGAIVTAKREILS